MDQTRVVRVDPEHAERFVGELAAHVGLPERESWTPAEAADLLRRLEYECTPATIGEFIRKGYFGPENDQALSPTDVFCLVQAMDSRRRWKATPSRHDPKKSGARLLLERQRAEGLEVFHDLDEFTLEDLLLRLVGTTDHATREVLYEGIVAKLAAQGFIEE